MTVFEQLFLAVLGPTLLAVWVWSWLGRSHKARWWTRSANGNLSLLVAIPTIGLVATGLILNYWGAPEWFGLTLMIFGIAVCGIWGFAISLVSMVWWPARRAWGPRWYTMQPKDAMWKTASGGDELTSARRRRPSWAGSEIETWKGTRILDDTKPSRSGATKGHLWVSEGGVWFNPSLGVDSSAPAVADRWDDIVGARVVAGNEDGDGRTVSGVLNRSLMPRLVIMTTDGNRMFEIVERQAATAAKIILQTKKDRS